MRSTNGASRGVSIHFCLSMKPRIAFQTCSFEVIPKETSQALNWVCSTPKGKILLQTATGSLSLVSPCLTSVYSLQGSGGAPSRSITRVSYAPETDTLYFIQRSTGELLSDASSDTLWKVEKFDAILTTEWSPEPVISAADTESTDLQLFDCGSKAICQITQKLNTFKIFDLQLRKSWRYLNPHGLSACKFIDASDYTLLVGSTSPQETNPDRDWKQITYVLVCYSREWVAENQKKIKYLEGVSIEWITTVDRHVWIVFADCKLVVVDLKRDPAEIVVHTRLDAIPLKIEVHHATKRIILAFEDKIQIWASSGVLVSELSIDQIYRQAFLQQNGITQVSHPEQLVSQSIHGPYDFVLVEHKCTLMGMIQSPNPERPFPVLFTFDLSKEASALSILRIEDSESEPQPNSLSSLCLAGWSLQLVLCAGEKFISAKNPKSPQESKLLRVKITTPQ